MTTILVYNDNNDLMEVQYSDPGLACNLMKLGLRKKYNDFIEWGGRTYEIDNVDIVEYVG